MARKSSDSGGKVKAPPDVYVGLLSVSIAALIIGIALLVLELQEYAWQLG